MKNNNLLEAIRIGNQLLTEAENTQHGIFWTLADLDINTNKLIWIESETVYKGTSGVALFLIELFNQTNDKKYLEGARKAMQWVEWYCKKHPTSNYSFLTGRIGVSFVYLRLYQITHKKFYLTKALAIAKDSLLFLNRSDYLNEFINGIAGTLLVLIHLHAETNETWILDYIQKYTDALLKNARFGKVGLYWDVNSFEIRPLCGFSHGSSGIGYVFLELGNYFQNSAFYYIAKQAFLYENYYFNKKTNNWPDFRLNFYNEKKRNTFENEYQKGDLKSFITSSDMNAWCHGAAGIGLSRLHAKELLNNSAYNKDIQNVHNKTVNTVLSSFTLCHGNGGNADFFIEEFLTIKNKKSLKDAQKIANNALKQKSLYGKYISGLLYDVVKYPEDPSLFNGIAGIGYFFLRLSNPHKVPSILKPKVNTFCNKKNTKLAKYTKILIKRIIFSNMFFKTLALIQEINPHKIEDYLYRDKSNLSDLDLFISFVSNLIPTMPTEHQEKLKDIFSFELKKTYMLLNTSSMGLLYIKDKLNEKQAAELMKLSNTILLKKKLKISPECELFVINHPEIKKYLLRSTPYGVEELEINDFCYHVLKEFTNKKTLAHVVNSLKDFYLSQQTIDKKVIEDAILAQIKEAIEYTILLTL